MNTKLILIKKVFNLGKKGEIVEVSPGYARNFLVPQGLAKIATEKEMKTAVLNQKKEKEKKHQELEQVQEIKEQLDKSRV